MNHLTSKAKAREFDRRQVLRLGVIGGVGAMATATGIPLFSGPAQPASRLDDLVLINGNEPLAVVVRPDGASAQIVHAAEDIVNYLEQCTDVRLPSVVESEAGTVDPSAVRIYVGMDGTTTNRQLNAVAEDGYTIECRPGVVAIVGNSDRGTRFGSYDFLERFAGVRWVMPGDFGTITPQASRIVVPATTRVVAAPAFSMRSISPIWSRTDSSRDASPTPRWGAYARSNYELRFSHGLWRWLPVAKFADPNSEHYRPDFFPLIDGQHRVPSLTDTMGATWQPRFCADGIAEAVANEILAQIAADPRTWSHSVELGIHDNNNFSEDDVDTNHLDDYGRVQASESYYQFVNAVAGIVTAVRPTVRFGLLAYFGVQEPPSFELHANVVPVLTRERLGWADPGLEQRDRALTLRWVEKANEIGWYDYRYGWQYAIPRIDAKLSQRAYRFARDAGVRHSYAEFRPTWNEPSKASMAMAQLWNPDIDVDEFRADWARLAVGPDATPSLLAFEDLWEVVWNTKISKTGWFVLGVNFAEFLRYNDDDYLAAVDENTVSIARSHMDNVVALATTPDQKARAAYFERAFRFSEASVLSYPRPVNAPTTSGAAVAMLEHGASTLDRNIALATERFDMYKVIGDDPLVGKPGGFQDWQRWPGWNAHPVWAIGEWIAGNETASGSPSGPVSDRAVALVADASVSDEVRRFCRSVLAVGSGDVEQLAPVTGGNEFVVSPGRVMRSHIRYRTDSQADVAGLTIRWVWELLSGTGAIVKTLAGVTYSLSETQGEWAPLVMAHLVPAGTARVRTKISVRGSRFADTTISYDGRRHEFAASNS